MSPIRVKRTYLRSLTIAGVASVGVIVTILGGDEVVFYAMTKAVTIVNVRDGDGPRIEIDGKPVVCRMEGVDAPELDQPGGQESKQALERWTFGNKVRATFNGTDLFRRPLVTLYVDRKNLNVQLVERGEAHWYRLYASKRFDLAAAQERARAAKLGLWGAEEPPITPWDWRREHK